MKANLHIWRGLLWAMTSLWATLAAAQDMRNAELASSVVEVALPPGWIPPGWIVIEEDIQVPAEFIGAPDGTFTANLWTDKKVPIAFDPNVTDQQKQIAIQALTNWEEVCAVDFVAHGNQANWVYIREAGPGLPGNSAVGMVGGMQVMNVETWDFKTLHHEFGHVLGLWHEQTREDRDQYVIINYNNICQICCAGGTCNYHFDIRPEPGGEYGPYDFESVMHLGQFSYAKCSSPGCETIVVKPPNQSYQSLIGTHSAISFWDARVMSFLYAEDNWRFLDDDNTFVKLGTFFLPYQGFSQAVSGTPENGVLWIQPGVYGAVGVWDKPMTIRAPLGNATLGD